VEDLDEANASSAERVMRTQGSQSLRYRKIWLMVQLQLGRLVWAYTSSRKWYVDEFTNRGRFSRLQGNLTPAHYDAPL
jgi:hypothetical protein